MLRTLRISVLPLLFVALIVASCRHVSTPNAVAPPIYAPMIEPTNNAIFTATNEVRALDWDGTAVWAATAGGVLLWQGGKATKWTRNDGLPANEAFDLERENGKLSARFPLARAVWDGTDWQVQDAPAWKRGEPTIEWNKRKVAATLTGLKIDKEEFALPSQSNGTHVSALLARGKVILVAVLRRRIVALRR